MCERIDEFCQIFSNLSQQLIDGGFANDFDQNKIKKCTARLERKTAKDFAKISNLKSIGYEELDERYLSIDKNADLTFNINNDNLDKLEMIAKKFEKILKTNNEICDRTIELKINTEMVGKTEAILDLIKEVKEIGQM